MARIIPSDISALAMAGAHSGELETLALLKADLGSAYSVFHSVHWSSSQSHGIRVGEIDFIIVNRAGHVLCIEQKNGALVETPEGLAKVYGQRQKSVNSQIHRSLDQVRDKFRWQQRQAPPGDQTGNLNTHMSRKTGVNIQTILGSTAADVDHEQ